MAAGTARLIKTIPTLLSAIRLAMCSYILLEDVYMLAFLDDKTVVEFVVGQGQPPNSLPGRILHSGSSCWDGAGGMNVTSSPFPPLTLGQAEATVLNVTITRYTTAAAVVILLYDWLITLSDEVRVGNTCIWLFLILFDALQIRLVWPGPFTIPKLLYYINRYVSIVGIIAYNYCVSVYDVLIRL